MDGKQSYTGRVSGDPLRDESVRLPSDTGGCVECGAPRHIETWFDGKKTRVQKHNYCKPCLFK